jgi:glycosyltransferase involved in cell wall biosynthesis
MKKLSVILTTYNSEKHIQRTLDSVFNQSGLNEEFSLELLVIDDCSNDKTTEILTKNNIEYLTTGSNSGGPNKGRNIGLKKATGDFICIMDHDDEWLPEKTISQLKLAHLAPIITCGFTVINPLTHRKNNIVNFSKKSSGYNIYEKNSTFLQILSKEKKGQIAYLGGIMFSRSLQNIYFEDCIGMIDYDWVLRLFYNNLSVEICVPLFNRYVEKSNLSLNKSYRIKDYNFSLQTLEAYRNNYPIECVLATKRINGTLARYYYFIGEMKNARYYFVRSSFSLKTILYYLTSFYGYKFVKRKFRTFT